jgi:hypothetical protein
MKAHVLQAIRARRHRIAPLDAAAHDARVSEPRRPSVSFERPTIDRALEVCCTPLLTVLFVGSLAVVFGLSTVRLAGERSSPVALEIAPDGVWLTGVGTLPWDDIAEVRLERRWTASGEPAGRRLAFVLRTGARVDRPLETGFDPA